ncbi:MAG: winged helix-turn-helix transcriptional regulator [Bacteroidales bacterium]
MKDSSKRKIVYEGETYYCSLAFVMDVIGDKYKSLILFHLIDGAQRSSDLQRTITGVSNRMFTYSVRSLEKNGLVERIVYPEVPPRVEYELTPLGRSIIPVIQSLDDWGKSFAESRNLYKDDD